MLAVVFLATTAAWNLTRLIASIDIVDTFIHDSALAILCAAAVIYLVHLLFSAAAGFFVASWASRVLGEASPGLRAHLRDCVLLYAILLVVAAGWFPWRHRFGGFLLTWALAALGGLAGDAAYIGHARRRPIAHAV